jgi:hypothetical protein
LRASDTMSADKATYLDSSALVKLAVREPESAAPAPLPPAATTALDAAGAMQPVELRSLEAIHLATAQQLGADLARIVTYDDRMPRQPITSA